MLLPCKITSWEFPKNIFPGILEFILDVNFHSELKIEFLGISSQKRKMIVKSEQEMSRRLIHFFNRYVHMLVAGLA